MLTKKEDVTKRIQDRDDGISISIGEENSEEDLKNCSVITASYMVNGKPVGKIGVIGPTRMRYSEIVSLMGYLTHNMNEVFKIGDIDE